MMLEGITEALARIKVPGAFASRRTAAADDLDLQVEGVGPIKLPVSMAQARRLCSVARPARYGLREKTLLDERVRNSREITRSRIKIDQGTWKPVLHRQLEQIRRDLGLDSGCKLKAQLHDMLVYGPGQFFVPHQDSEKTDDMVGTLVVTLPSAFKGGGLVIEHHDEKVSYRGSRDALTFVAFYADCHHEVRPVKEGYRVVLTYNLVLENDAKATRAPGDEKLVEALAERMRSYFESPGLARGRDEPGQPPDRLVYLLDHQYTEKGLGWHRLKNADAARAGALRQVAERLGCEIFLALADVHEMWSCEEDEWYERRRRRWSYDEDEEDDFDGGDDAESYTLVELCDWDIELRHFISPSGGKPAKGSTGVPDDEVCYTKASDQLEPFRSEHEGYMGNYGNTVDRWYHRAAVVLWPRERTFILRAKTSAAWAMRQISRALAGGSVAEARGMAERLSPFWNGVASREGSPRFVADMLRVTAALDSPQLAASLLQPVTLDRLTPDAAPGCIALVERYGLEWLQSRFMDWASHTNDDERNGWLASAPRFLAELCRGGSVDCPTLGRSIARGEWTRLAKEWQTCSREVVRKYELRELASLNRPILGLLEASVATQDLDLRRDIVEAIGSADSDNVLSWLLRLLRTAHGRRARAGGALGLVPLYEHCARALTRCLGPPAREPDDWSIAAPDRCKCPLCKKLAEFLMAANESLLEWPLAARDRTHVHGILDDYGLPVRHETRRSGRPYTLVLTKTKALFEREATKRGLWQRELAWLQGVAEEVGFEFPISCKSFAPS